MKKHRTFSLVPFVIPALFLLLWHIAAVKANNQVVVPPPEQVGELFASPFASVIGMGSLASNILVSLARVLTGYALAVAVGIPLGIAMGHSPLSHELLNLFLSLFRPIPPLTWVPLVLAWFGVASFATIAGVEEGALFVPLNNLKLSMLFIIFIGAVYPILSGAIHGVRGVRTILIDSARTLGASDRDIFRSILLPGAMPSIVNGLRVGLGVAWMCLVSAEMLPGSISGVGYLITHAYTLARTDVVVAGMAGIGFVGALLDYGFRRIEERKFQWVRLSR